MRAVWLYGVILGMVMAMGGVPPTPVPTLAPSRPSLALTAHDVVRVEIAYLPPMGGRAPRVARRVPTARQDVHLIVAALDALTPEYADLPHTCGADRLEGARIVVTMRAGRTLTARYDRACGTVSIAGYLGFIDARQHLWTTLLCLLHTKKSQQCAGTSSVGDSSAARMSAS